MSNIKKLMMSAAGGGGLDVDEVFSTYLYEGNGGSQTITNGIDISGEGGLVWVKDREEMSLHKLFDTNRGATKYLSTASTSEEQTNSGTLTSFNSDGFSVGSDGDMNKNGNDIASWTFRKAPKFFDIVTYTGNGASQNISHNLGCVPGMIIVKNTSAAANWAVWHRGNTSTEYQHLQMNTTSAALSSATVWNSTNPTDTVFSVGNYYNTNNNGSTYVAYLFAHNDGDGEFGPDGDQDIIKCGSYTANNSGDGPVINLGFEPQLLLIKRASGGTANWFLADSMRGLPVGHNATMFLTDTVLFEITSSAPGVDISATGFQPRSNSIYVNEGSDTYVYMAIRRGSLFPPEDATKVFAPNFYGTNGYVGYLGAPADMSMVGYRNGNSQNAAIRTRMLPNNKGLVTATTSAEVNTSSSWDNMLGVSPVGSTLTTLISWTWKRAPGYFDVVAYKGDGVTGQAGAVKHNLGVAPEMIWGKNRGSGTWNIYHEDILSSDPNGIVLFDTNPSSSNNGQYYYGNQSVLVQPTATEVILGSAMKSNNADFVMYLFATLAGISKVGSYTGSSGSVDVDCGFTSGARFVLVKRIDSTGSWYVWDTERGIVSGNDPYLILNSTTSEITGNDFIDPLPSGFTVNTGSASINTSGGSYIFYAIA